MTRGPTIEEVIELTDNYTDGAHRPSPRTARRYLEARQARLRRPRARDPNRIAWTSRQNLRSRMLDRACCRQTASWARSAVLCWRLFMIGVQLQMPPETSCNECWTKTCLLRWAQSRLSYRRDLTTLSAIRTATQTSYALICAIFPRSKVPSDLKRRKQGWSKTWLPGLSE